MAHLYDERIAAHYRTYRPPLHGMILERSLPHQLVDRALDIGCGTGSSSRALLTYSEAIEGVDISDDMLSKVSASKRINYSKIDGVKLPFEEDSFSLITLAGVWNYAKGQERLQEIKRVLKPNGKVLIYDFEVDLKRLVNAIGIKFSIPKDHYEYTIDFSGFNTEPLDLIKKETGVLAFPITNQNAVHLMLSDFNIFEAYLPYFPENEMYRSLLQRLKKNFKRTDFILRARYFYALYQLNRK